MTCIPRFGPWRWLAIGTFVLFVSPLRSPASNSPAQGWRDDFDSATLHPRWTWRVPVAGPQLSLTECPGWLRIRIPERSSGFNHWNEPEPMDDAPQLRTPAPTGDWELEGRVRLQEPNPGSHFHVGLTVGVSDAMLLTWGPFQGPGLTGGPKTPEVWLEPTGSSGYARVPGDARDLILRLTKEGDTFRASLRRPGEEWQEGGAFVLSQPPVFLGLIGKTFSPGPGITFDVDYVSLKPRPAAPPTRRPPPAAPSSDWPRFLGPNGNGISPEKGISKSWKEKPPRTLWTVALRDGGYAGPSVADGKVFIIDHEGSQDVVRALDLDTGREVWRFPYRDQAKGYYGFARSTPTWDGGRLYTISRFGLVHCLDAKSGKPIWSRDILADFKGKLMEYQFAASPVIDGNKVILCPGGPNAAVVALDKLTGKTIWQGGGSDAGGYATPVVATLGGKKQYVVFTSFSLIGVDAENGRLLWRLPRPADWDVNAPTPLILGESIFITSFYGGECGLVEVVGNQPTFRWRNREMLSTFSTPVLMGGALYCTTRSGHLVCLDPQNGKAHWKQPGFEWGGLVGVDGVLLVMDGWRGDLVMVEPSPAAYKELGRIRPLGGQSWTAPIVAHGRLIVRNKMALACLSLK